MVWVRLDDRFDENEKVVQVGPLGMAMYVAGLCFCNRNLTDGFIPASQARRLIDTYGVGWHSTKGLAGTLTDVTQEMVAELLVAAGLWEICDGGYLVHDFEGYQPLKAQVLRERDLTTVRQRRHRVRLKRNAVSNAVNNGHVTRAPEPEPVPEPKKNTKRARRRRTDDGGAGFDVWNEHCHPLPKAKAAGADRGRRWRDFLQLAGPDAPAAVRAAAQDPYYRQRRYGLDTFLRHRERWVDAARNGHAARWAPEAP